jgi:integrase
MVAFAVAQSCEAPMRPEDQKMLIVGQHIRKIKAGGKEVLAIQTVARKTKVDLDFELSGDIVAFYDAYNEERPRISEPGNEHLYPGNGRGPKFRTSLSQQMGEFMEDELGLRMTGQKFRHVIGYVYLKTHPGDYETVRQLLGHTDISTTMKFYASMDMREASKRVSSFVDRKRRELAPLLRKRRSKVDPNGP